MKKKYQNLEVSVWLLSSMDVLTVSGYANDPSEEDYFTKTPWYSV